MQETTLRPLLDLDPDLGVLLDAESGAAARRDLRVAVIELGAGPWNADALSLTHPGNLGLLMVSGLLARQVMVHGTTSTELLGPGDLVRPWRIETGPRLLEPEVRWNVLSPVRAAIIDQNVNHALNAYPGVRAAIVDRVNERAQRLAVTQALSQLTGVELRLEALLWHLADRWGKVTGQGVVVPLPLSHRLLGELIGARRPTVSTALARLAREGRVTRTPGGGWLLRSVNATALAA